MEEKLNLQRWVTTFDTVNGEQVWFTESGKPMLGINPPCSSSAEILRIDSDNKLERICDELEELGVKTAIYCERWTDKNGEKWYEEFECDLTEEIEPENFIEKKE